MVKCVNRHLAKIPEKEKSMRKMNRIIPFALACAIFAAQPVQAATIIRDSDKQTTSQNTQTTNSRDTRLETRAVRDMRTASPIHQTIQQWKQPRAR